MIIPLQILLVQTSFEMAGGDGRALAARLGGRLGAGKLAPAEHAHQLAGVLVLAVRGLSRRRLLRPAMRRLGARHADAWPAAQDAAFHRALLEALEDVLGAGLPNSVREAWSAGHRMLAALVREGAGLPASRIGGACA